MKFRISLLLVVVLLAAAPLMVTAQDDGGLIGGCFDLSEEDCAIIQSATENTQTNVQSFNQDFTLAFSVGGLETLPVPGLPVGLNLEVSGSGPFAFTPEADQPLALRLDLLVNALLPENAVENAEVPFAIVDGYLYTIAQTEPGVAELVGVPLEAAEGADLPVDLGGLLGSNPESLADLGGDLDGLLNPSGTDMGFLEAGATYQRLADVEMMGQTMYPFAFNLDLGVVLDSPEVTAAITALQGQLGAAEDPMVGLAAALLPQLLSGVTANITATQFVGADDNFIHRLELDIAFALDLSILTMTPGMPTPDPETDGPAIPPLTLDFDFSVNLSDINGDITVTAPEGARLLTVEEAEELFGSLGENLPTVPGLPGTS